MKKVVAVVLTLCLLPAVLAGCKSDEKKPENEEPKREGYVNEVKVSMEKNIRMVNKMPAAPSNYELKDWKQVAADLDALIYDFDLKGKYAPFGGWVKRGVNTKEESFWLRTFVGGAGYESAGEAINQIGSVLAATLVGIDKSDQNGKNYVNMLNNFYSRRWQTITNCPGRDWSDFWYQIYPNVLYFMVADNYMDEEGIQDKLKNIAEGWTNVFNNIKKESGKKLTFEYTYYDFATKKPVNNGKFVNSDAPAGIAYIMYMSYKLFGDTKYLDIAKECMQYLNDLRFNPAYEVLYFYLPYLAARMNIEQGTDYDVDKFVNWAFDSNSNCRGGWGVVVGKWGDYEINGLMGSTVDWGGGSAYAMNTFDAAGGLVPFVKYDARYAKAIGKWMLNLASNSRLFYSGELPRNQESSPDLESDPNGLIAYEGLRSIYNGKSPYAMGDAVLAGWAETDRGLYGGTHVGILASLIETTNVDQILKLDCTKTSYFDDSKYPTFLLYNPYNENKTVEINVGDKQVDIYDSVTNSIIANDVSGNVSIEMAADSAMVLVYVDSEDEIKMEDNKVMAGESIISVIKPSIVFLNDWKAEEVIKNNTKIKLAYNIPSNDSVSNVEVKFGTHVLYSGDTVPESIEFNAMEAPIGQNTLRVTLTTANGLTDTSSCVLRNQ